MRYCSVGAGDAAMRFRQNAAFVFSAENAWRARSRREKITAAPGAWRNGMDISGMLRASSAILIAVAWKILRDRLMADRPLADRVHAAHPGAGTRAGAVRHDPVALLSDRPLSRPERRALGRDSRILRRRDDDVRGVDRGGRRGDRRRLGRPARELRGRRVPRVPASVQSRRCGVRRRRVRNTPFPSLRCDDHVPEPRRAQHAGSRVIDVGLGGKLHICPGVWARNTIILLACLRH